MSTLVLQLNKLKSFIKHYWYIPVGFVVTIIFLLILRDRKYVIDWAKTLSDASDAHKQEIEVIENAHRLQRAADARALRRMKEAEQKVRDEFERNKKVLDAEQEKRVKQIIKQLKDDPHALADALERETGARIIIIE